MRLVHAAVLAGDFRQLDDFFRRRKRTGLVEQPGAEPERAVLHRLLDQIPFLLDFLRRRLAIDAADHRLPYGALSNEEPDVRRLLKLGELLEKWREGQRRRAVGPFDQRGDALPYVVVSG